MSVEANTREFLQARLVEVALFRSQGSPADRLQSLLHAVLSLPVFPDWPSPIEDWLDELRRLASEVRDDEALALAQLRQAGVHLRRLQWEAARDCLDSLQLPRGPAADRLLNLQAATRSRLFTRLHRFDEARQALRDLPEIPPNDWASLFPEIAEAEWCLETGANPEAVRRWEKVLTRLPDELIEERIQIHQCLAFAASSAADAPGAQKHFQLARELLRGAGVWPEVIQTDLVLGSFAANAGELDQAEALFEEGLELVERCQRRDWEPALRLGLARARGALDPAAAQKDALAAAHTFGERGQALGFLGALILVHQLQVADRDFESAYRTLAVGLSLARRWNTPFITPILRRLVNTLRDQTLGPQAFDAMVTRLVAEMKSPPPPPDPP